MNLGQIRERAKYRARDIGNVLTSDDIWDGHINAVYHKFLNRTEFGLEMGQADIIFAAGDASKSLPTDVYQILAIRDITNNSELTPILTWRQLITEFPDISSTGTSYAYRIQGGTLSLYPVTQDAVTVRIYYYEPADTLDADSDVPIIPERYHEALVYGAVAEAHRDDQNLQVAGSYMKQFEELVMQAIEELTQPAHGEFTPLPRSPRPFERLF